MDRIETVESEYWYDFKMAVSRSNDKMVCRPLSLPAAYTHFECSFTSSILLPMCISVQNDLGYRPYRTQTECLHVFLVNNRWRELWFLCYSLVNCSQFLPGSAHLLWMSLSCLVNTAHHQSASAAQTAH